MLRLKGEIEYERWRGQMLALLHRDVDPAGVQWIDPRQDEHLWAASESRASEADGLDLAGATKGNEAGRVRVPREFPRLARHVLCHRSVEKWSLLHRLLVRTMREGGAVLSNPLDADTMAAGAMAKSVRRDVHKMRAFVRFCRVAEGPRGEHYVAYHRPDHPILTLAAPFFARRFGVLHWTILTPQGSATWFGGQLAFGPPVPRERAPSPDSLEEFWTTYYASTFNPARVNPRAMAKEMPKKYWSTLPEAEIIERLLAEAPERTGAMLGRSIGGPAGGAAAFVPRGDAAPLSLPVLHEAAASCRGCGLYEQATCAVFGEGPSEAEMMLVGEQPGDQEDLAGRPFVGPAGQLLNRALAEAGVDRGACYVTNAVKHFKWEPAPRGKRRIHAKPSTVEVRACRPWLEAELSVVRPRVLVLLGSTAGQSLLGAGFRVTQSRGKVLRDTPLAPAVVATIHPSAILRIGDEAMAEREFASMVADLRMAGAVLTG